MTVRCWYPMERDLFSVGISQQQDQDILPCIAVIRIGFAVHVRQPDRFCVNHNIILLYILFGRIQRLDKGKQRLCRFAGFYGNLAVVKTC